MTVLHEANIRKILVYGKAGPQGCEIYEPSLAFKAPLVAGLSRSSMSSTSPKGHLGMMWTSIGKTEESCGCADLSSVAQTRASPAVAPRIKSQSSFSELRPSRRRPYLICRDTPSRPACILTGIGVHKLGQPFQGESPAQWEWCQLASQSRTNNWQLAYEVCTFPSIFLCLGRDSATSELWPL